MCVLGSVWAGRHYGNVSGKSFTFRTWEWQRAGAGVSLYPQLAQAQLCLLALSETQALPLAIQLTIEGAEGTNGKQGGMEKMGLFAMRNTVGEVQEG